MWQPAWVKLTRTPFDMVEQGGYLFFLQALEFGGFTIGRVKTDGTELNEELIPEVSGSHLAVNAGHLYYYTENETGRYIGRANHDGTGNEPTWVKITNLPAGLAADAAHIYWSDEFAHAISRMTVAGTGLELEWLALAESAAGPVTVRVDAAHIYWRYSAGAPEETHVGRAAIGGGELELLWLNAKAALFNIAVNTNFIWVMQGESYIGRATIGAGGFVKEWFKTGGPEAYAAASDSEFFYVALNNSNAIGRMSLEEAEGEGGGGEGEEHLTPPGLTSGVVRRPVR